MKNLKFKAKSIGLIILVVILTVVLFTGCSSQPTSSTKAVQNTAVDSNVDQDNDGITDAIEKTYGTNPYTADTDGDGVNDKADQTPVVSEKLIEESSTVPLPVSIKDVRVEDNATADHLEIKLQNTSNQNLDHFDIYFTITDKKTNATESYYQVLSGLTLAANETKIIHFDNEVKTQDHFYGNMNGLYGTSANGLTFDINLHSEGYQVLQFSVDKSEGTAEVAD